ncbi:MAG: cobalamin-binding protein [Melioribacteraceae bacterium]|nr:cobalamin-binding protein [Melioribacteraceae bacterium]
MKHFFVLPYIFLIYISLTSCGEEKPFHVKESITDDMGYEHKFEKIPQRVVTLAPNLTEIIYELGAEDKLIGNTTYCNYPPSADTVAKVGDLLSINYEKLVTLNPDLIFITVEGNNKETFDKIKSFGLDVFISNPRNFEGIKKTYLDFAKIFNLTEPALQKINGWNAVVDSIKQASSKRTGFLTLFLVSIKPMMAAGKNTFINEFIEFSNLQNLVSDSITNYPFLSREKVLKSNPDIIIHTQHGYDNNLSIDELYPEWADIKAVRNNMVFYVNPDIYFRPGPRFVEALKDLNRIIAN